MAEYIDMETAIAWFMPYAHAGESIDADVVISDIKGMKAADVAPVRHGRWVEYKIPPIVCCSNCDWATDVKEKDFQYCPNCGAKMYGDGKEGSDNG